MRLTHYTDKHNLGAIRKSRVLKCALSLMTESGEKDHSREKRPRPLPLSSAVLRDQQPLTSRIELSDGATFADFIQYLNEHVFFWASTRKGKDSRKRFRSKYRHPDHIGLCCGLQDLRDANQGVNILYSPYNSGTVPRNPKAHPRSLGLFQPLESCNERQALEIVVRGEVRLPDNTQEEYEDGKWRNFFS